MTVLILTHPACLDHNPGPDHPERPARLHAVLEALDGPDLLALPRQEAPQATRAQLEAVHAADYVERIFAVAPERGFVGLDADTWMSRGSLEAALRAAGAVCAGVDAVCTGAARRAFAAVRPPGHHAEADRAMGFCLFNNVAVGAAWARAAHGVGRVAIIDFDVHHGNGTQHIFEAEPAVAYASTHQHPHYPGTGDAHEVGVGNIFNAPLPMHADSRAFRDAWTGLLARLDAFAPDLLLLSAGFDAHRDDPLADVLATDDDYAWISAELARLADARCQGRLVSALEGGYDLDVLRRCVPLHLLAMT